MVVALLATSVTVVTMRQEIVIVAKMGRSPRGVSSSATQRDRPDSCTHSESEVDGLPGVSPLKGQFSQITRKLFPFTLEGEPAL